MTITPSLNYKGIVYFNTIEKNWDPALDSIIVSRLNQLHYIQALSPNLSLSYSPRIFGMFYFKKGRVSVIRHVMSPSLSFSYRPDLGYDFGKYQRTLLFMQEDEKGKLKTFEQNYSIFDEGIYNLPSVAGRYGSINFNVGNTLEMKVKNPADTTGKENKVKLLENLSLSTSYDIFKDSINLSPISLQARTRIMEQFDLSFSSSLNAYAVDTIYRSGRPYVATINKFEVLKSGKPARLTDANFTLSFALPLKKKKEKTQAAPGKQPGQSIGENTGMGMGGGNRWNARIEYNFRYSKPAFESRITQTLRLSGDLAITDKWSVNASSGYDFVLKEFTYTMFSLRRDLHCWTMQLDLVPFGQRKSYTFTIQAKANMLKDIRYRKEYSWFDNLN
jgi:hypothetical protein